MSNYFVKGEQLTSIADAIRAKANTTDKLTFPTGMVSAINNISTGEYTTQIDNTSAYQKVVPNNAKLATITNIGTASRYWAQYHENYDRTVTYAGLTRTWSNSVITVTGTKTGSNRGIISGYCDVPAGRKVLLYSEVLRVGSSNTGTCYWVRATTHTTTSGSSTAMNASSTDSQRLVYSNTTDSVMTVYFSAITTSSRVYDIDVKVFVIDITNTEITDPYDLELDWYINYANEHPLINSGENVKVSITKIEYRGTNYLVSDITRIPVYDGGVLTFVNDSEENIPSTVEYIVKT